MKIPRIRKEAELAAQTADDRGQSMSRLVIQPTDYPALSGPLVFLAGPIKGAPLWQTEAIQLLGEFSPELHIATPRRQYQPGEFQFEGQVDWETHHLRYAGKNGVILFWLANELQHQCDRAYAQTTRFELAEWKVRHERDGARLVVGIDSRFTGAKYIRQRLEQDCPAVSICDTLAESCRIAAALCRQTFAAR
jgi:hypothetical protein